jgi:predicted polyphosphate/ATP-dependent NAD kinase
MAVVGIIANPASGKDIRRIVAFGSVFDNQEKVRIVRRILLGLEAAGVRRVQYMPDYYGIVERAREGLPVDLEISRLEFKAKADQRDTTWAAQLLAENGAGCIVTLGGDGTNRVAAKGAGSTPLLPLSTGTNNVFPVMIESSVAGLAAGLLASGKVPLQSGTFRSTRLEVMVEGLPVDIALVDAVVCQADFLGSRAVWKTEEIRQVFLNRASPDATGFSSIGGMLVSIAPQERRALYLEMGSGGKAVTALVAPGVIETVLVKSQLLLEVGQEVGVNISPCVIALDGEREVEVKRGEQVGIRLANRGPVVVDVRRTMAAAAELGLLVSK